MGRHRGATRPRYGRILAAFGALVVTLVAVLGGIGLFPAGDATAPTGSATRAETSGEPVAGALALADQPLPDTAPQPAPSAQARNTSDALPARSGKGKRVVFSIDRQRVWLVDGKEAVVRSYLVSGSVTDNLEPGRYAVYSRSRHAVGIEDSGRMGYMVRFAHGRNAAIGFHDIPVLDGRKVQVKSQLGTPQSHGCIRQWRPDAKALWDFTPVGTEVVVLA